MTQTTNTKFYTICAEGIYNYHKKPTDDFFEQKLKGISSGWKMIDSFTNENGYNYKGAALINTETKEIVITSAGTDPTSFYDIIDDIKLALGYAPNKLQSVKDFASRIVNKITDDGHDVSQYTFNTTGHSLGGVMSDLLIVELKSREYNTGHSYTFDNPGSAPVIKYASEQNMFSGKIDISGENFFEVHQNQSNIINTTNFQAGENKHKLMVTKPVKIESMKEEASGWFSSICKTASNVVSSLTKFIPLANKVVETIANHKMGNFIKHYDEENAKEVSAEYVPELGKTFVDLTTSQIELIESNSKGKKGGEYFFTSYNSKIAKEIDDIEGLTSESWIVPTMKNIKYEELQEIFYNQEKELAEAQELILLGETEGVQHEGINSIV